MTRHPKRASSKRGSRSSVDRLFAEALGLHQAGRQQDAESLYRQVLAVDPRHADSLHLLGVLAFQVGDYPTADDFFRQAIEIKADVPFYHNNRGNAFKLAGRFDEAGACYRRAIALKPDFTAAYNNLGALLNDQGFLAEALEQYRQALVLEPTLADLHNNLGIVLQQQGRREEAMAAYRQAILLRPDFAQAHSNLGNGLRDQGDLEQAAAHYRTALTFIPEWAEAHYNLAGVVASQGRLEEAVAGYQQALALKPDFAEAYNNLGSLFKTLGRSEAALGCFRQALVLKPDYAEAHNNLGNVLKEQGHGAGAVAHYQRAIVLRPSFAEAHNNLGTVFQDQGLIDQAVVQYRRALALNPDYAEAHYNLGVVHQDRGLLDAAAACYRLAVAKRPDFVEAYNNLGNTLKDQGRFQEALTRYDQALALKPDFAEVLFNRAELKTCQPGDPDVARLEALAADRRSLSADGAPFIHFALAKALDETGESVRAFQHLLMGNAAKRRQVVYDETASQDLFRRVAAAFDAGMFEHRRNTGAPSTIPIFVLGMPRSGSSLVEQILASHPEIQGGGELPTLAGVVGSGEPETVARLDDAALTDLGAAYLARLPPLAAGKTRLTDKMPYNFLYVGLIRLILPGARIIHTRRDPVETCVSCFSKLFPTGQAYSYDLGELGRYYRGYNALMAHWRSVLPADAMLEVSYEAVVGDLEAQARRLIAYCGLSWDERCLDFYKNQRPVRTASAVQVRQPLFRTSLHRWHRYEAWLEPLRRALDEDQTGP